MQRRIYFYLLGVIFIICLSFWLLSGLWFESTVVMLAALLAAGFVSKQVASGFIKSLEGLEKDDNTVYVYEDFVPYIRKVNRMRDDMKLQIDTLKYRSLIIESITQHMNEGLILLDIEGHILIANKRAMSIFKLETIRENILHICRDADFQSSIKACLAGSRLETRLLRDNRVYNVFADPVRGNDGKLNGGAVIFFDVTDSIAMEKQRREFSANVSHELRTPLTAISGLAEMMTQGMVANDDIPGFAGKIYAQAISLIEVINDIIGLSELDEGGIDKRYEPFNIEMLIYSVIENLKQKAYEKNIEITVEASGVSVYSDRRLIETLLRNLIDNAVKYNNDGGKVTVKAEQMKENGGGWLLCVEDTGIGIPSIDRQRVFERFYRVDKSRNKKTGGTGLGLSIVKHIMEHLGGSVELESEPGKGTKVSCTFSHLAH